MQPLSQAFLIAECLHSDRMYGELYAVSPSAIMSQKTLLRAAGPSRDDIEAFSIEMKKCALHCTHFGGLNACCQEYRHFLLSADHCLDSDNASVILDQYAGDIILKHPTCNIQQHPTAPNNTQQHPTAPNSTSTCEHVKWAHHTTQFR